MIVPIAEESMELKESIRKADILIQGAAERIMKVILAGKNGQ